MDQKALSSKPLFSNGNQVAWMAELPGSKAKYLAVFNIGDKDSEQVSVKWADLGLPAKCTVRDLWAKKDIGVAQDARTFEVKPHASGFYKISAAQ